MIATDDRIAVKESHGERFVYEVQSDTNPKIWYRVDLTANNGGTRCACKDFRARRQPEIDAGGPLLTSDTLCKHAKAALRHFTLQLLQRLAKDEDRAPR